MNLTKIKKALAHASQQELKDVMNWITARDLELTKREKEAREQEAWDRVKNLRAGDYVFVCRGLAENKISRDNKGVGFKTGTRITVSYVRPRRRELVCGNFTFQIPAILSHDLRPQPTDEVREAAMRLLLDQ